MKTNHLVTVLGREISVRSSASAEKVHGVELFVNGKLQEIGSALRSGDAQLVLCLALLNISEELLELRTGREKDAETANRLSSIIASLDTV